MNTATIRTVLTAARARRLNTTQAEALCLLVQHGKLPLGFLATELGISTGGITHISDALVRNSFAARSAGLEDRRQIWLEITPQGAEVIASLGSYSDGSRPCRLEEAAVC